MTGRSTRPAAVRVTIDRLTLVGVAPGDATAIRRALAAAVEGRLAGADSGALPGDRARVALTVGPTRGAAELGRAAGEAIGRHLAGGRR